MKTQMLMLRCVRRFGSEWQALTPEQKRLVFADFAALCRDEYDADDPLNVAAEENIENASIEYQRRIGRGNLSSYADCLVAGAARSA